MSVVQLDRTDPRAELLGSLEHLRAAYRREPYPTAEVRKERLRALRAVMLARREEIAEAIRADFGNRSKHETYIAEILTSNDSITHLIKHLDGWMRGESRSVSPTLWMATARVEYQPLGVIGVISPWNYPFVLCIVPVATAIAAGNRVMVKPSELTPGISEVIRSVLLEALGPDLVAVHSGGPEVGQAFSSLPFDHLLYTGSTHVGRLVMRAAAENLVPVTLELGGKSPCVVHPSYDIARFADRVAYGKTLNAGQTCIAPDYAIVPRGREQAFVDAFRASVARSYPTLVNNPDYTSVVNDRHYARLQGLLQDAVAKGARVVEINPAGETFDPASHRMPPQLVLDVTDDMKIMQEEIFGPLLPIVSVDSVEEALRYVNDRPRPLALYYFDTDTSRIAHVRTHTISGGLLVNDTMIHFAVEDVPFGGVGPSGMGAYHGCEGFQTFSHRKAVVQQSRVNGVSLIAPPFGATVQRLLSFLLG